jgi:type III secretion system FlhB-like substrate exporter
VPNDAFGGVKSATVDVEGHDSDGESSGTVEGDGGKGAVAEELISGAADADMDVAEDEDQWL